MAIEQSKTDLRKSLRKARREHVAAQPDAIRALLFHRPPGALLEKIGPEAIIGLYHATGAEAPAAGYARYFQDAGHDLVLPALDTSDGEMHFRQFSDAFGETDLDAGPYDIMQPHADAARLVPDIVFVPLVGFTTSGIRLGQGGGHYDKWLARHPGRLAVGLAWDAQLCDTLPAEPHDIALDAVVTPTRMYGPF